MAICELCDKGFTDFLSHVVIKHNISSIEEYNLKVNEKKEKDIKIRRLLDYMKELTLMFRNGQISAEEMRGLRTKWEKEHNLIW